jgi:mRNA-degrading endonuclease RelE of RelBE toxin-antitoxin system
VTGGPGAPFEIHWAAPARRALRRLPEKVASAVIEFVDGPLAGNPSRVGRPLRFKLEGVYSAHRGDYRVVYRIDDRRRRVQVLAIGHRADLYRRG